MLRRQTAAFFKETCKIEVKTQSSGSFGNQKRLLTLVANNVPCRVITSRTPRPAAEEVGSAEAIVEQYRLIVPYGTALAVNQVVTVGSTVYQIVDLVTERTDETDAQAVMVRARAS